MIKCLAKNTAWQGSSDVYTVVFLQKSGIPASELRDHLFMLRDSDATCHLFEVSAGLDSLVLGEGQILAQVKQVVRSGQNSGGLGKNIDRMFKDAITAGKRVRCETNISSGKELNCFGTFGFRYSNFPLKSLQLCHFTLMVLSKLKPTSMLSVCFLFWYRCLDI